MPCELLATDILAIPPNGMYKDVIPGLEHLSLSMVSFTFVAFRIIGALNFPRLLSLELWNCSQYIYILMIIVHIDKTNKAQPSEVGYRQYLSLNKFTLIMDKPGTLPDGTVGPPGLDQCVLFRFLLTFKGLRSVRLGLWGATYWNLVARGLLNHGDTLKYVIMHSEGRKEEDSGIELFYNIPWSKEIGCLCDIPSLIGLGITMQPWVLVSILIIFLLPFLPRLT